MAQNLLFKKCSGKPSYLKNQKKEMGYKIQNKGDKLKDNNTK